MRAPLLLLLVVPLAAAAEEKTPPTALSLELTGPLQTVLFNGAALPVTVELERQLAGFASVTVDGSVDFSLRRGELTTRYGAHLGVRFFPFDDGIDSAWVGLRLGTSWSAFWTGEALLGVGYSFIFGRLYLSPGIEVAGKITSAAAYLTFPHLRLNVGAAF